MPHHGARAVLEVMNGPLARDELRRGGRSVQSFSESIEISVSPEEAFDFLADPQTAHIIDPAVVYYRPERVPMDVGVRNHIKARFYGVPMKFVSEVKVWEPGHRMVLKNIKPDRPVRAVATHLFERHERSTRYTWSMEIHRTGPGGALIARIFRRLMQRNARKQQARFKEIIESRAG